MPDKTFDILIDIQARVSAIQDATKEMKNLTSEATSFSEAVKLGFGIDLVGRFTEALSEIPRLLGEAAKAGLEFNALLEQGRIGVAGMLKQFEPSKYQDFNKALGDSSVLIELLRTKANQLGLSFESMLEQYRTTAGALFAGGVTDLQKQVNLTVLLQQAMASLGITANQAQRDIFDILEGRSSRTAAGRALGITDADIEKASEAGQLYEFLTQKFAALSEAGAAIGNTFGAAEQRAKNLGQQLAGIATKDVFGELKKGLDAFNAALAKPQTAEQVSAVGSFTAAVIGGWEAIGKATSDALDKLDDYLNKLPAVKYLQQNSLNEALKSFANDSFFETETKITSQIYAQIQGASILEEKKKAFLALTGEIEKVTGREGDKNEEIARTATIVKEVLDGWLSTFDKIVGASAGLTNNLNAAVDAATKVANALAKIDAAHVKAALQNFGTPEQIASNDASDAGKAAYDAAIADLKKQNITGTEAETAAQIRRKAAEQDVLDAFNKEQESKAETLRLSLQEIEVNRLRATGETDNANTLDRTTKIEQEFNRLQSEGLVDAAQAWQLATKNVDAQKAIKDGKVAERDAQKELNALLGQQEALIRGIHQTQQLISESTFLSPDAKNALTIASMIGEIDALNTSIEASKEKIAGGALDPATYERVLERMQQAQFQMELLGQKLAALQKPLTAELADWVNGFGNSAHQIAGVIEGSINASLQGMNQLLIGAALRTGDWRQTLQGAESQILSLFLTWLEQMALQKGAALLGITTAETAQVASGAAITAAHAPAAAAVGISTYGIAAVVGAALVLAAIAEIEGGFEEGGYTGGRRGRAAGVVHGEEFVMDDESTRHHGIDNLYALMQGDAFIQHFGRGGRSRPPRDYDPGDFPGVGETPLPGTDRPGPAQSPPSIEITGGGDGPIPPNRPRFPSDPAFPTDMPDFIDDTGGGYPSPSGGFDPDWADSARGDYPAPSGGFDPDWIGSARGDYPAPSGGFDPDWADSARGGYPNPSDDVAGDWMGNAQPDWMNNAQPDWVNNARNTRGGGDSGWGIRGGGLFGGAFGMNAGAAALGADWAHEDLSGGTDSFGTRWGIYQLDKGYAAGARLPGAPSSIDTIPAMLAAGELVIPSDEVARADARLGGPNWEHMIDRLTFAGPRVHMADGGRMGGSFGSQSGSSSGNALGLPKIEVFNFTDMDALFEKYQKSDASVKHIVHTMNIWRPQ